MKQKLLTFILFLVSTFPLIAQINPVQNLSWSHGYDYGNNYFTLAWEEPEEPHDNLVGYNVYRENDLFIFVTGTSIYNIESPVNPDYGSNCGGESFLFYGNGVDDFTAFVTAVYGSEKIESAPQSIQVDGPLLSTLKSQKEKFIIYPNPSDGLVNIQNEVLKAIQVFDLNGRMIKQFEPSNQIDLSEISKGIYVIKLISELGVRVDKVVIR